MEADLFTPLLAMAVRFTLVLTVMLFIVVFERNTWSDTSGHE